MSDAPQTDESGDSQFAQLKLDDVAVEPDGEFAATLRQRLVARLAEPSASPQPPSRATTIASTTPGATMNSSHASTTATDRSHIEPGRVSLVPYLMVADARAAIDFYTSVLGAEQLGESIVMDDGRIGHAELLVGDAVLNLADEFPEAGLLGPVARGGASVSLRVFVADSSATVARAAAAGAIVEREVDEQHGQRSGAIVDPWGHRWFVATWVGGETAHDGFEVPTEAAAPRSTQAEDLWNEVGYYTIAVGDLARARTFYGGLFGWEFEEQNESPDGGIASHVRNSIVPFGLHQPAAGVAAGSGGPDTAGRIHPYFRVRDLDAMAERVRELGGTVESIDSYASGGAASCIDDQGIRFDLWLPADGY